MDADFSHPPTLVPRMLTTFRATGADIVVASRYVPGGSTPNWPFSRRLLSRTACMLARPLTPIRDAASGFFVIRREIARVPIQAGGFKICLELLVRAWPRRLVELPYRFDDRELGESKMSLREAAGYLVQLRDLYWLRATGGGARAAALSAAHRRRCRCAHEARPAPPGRPADRPISPGRMINSSILSADNFAPSRAWLTSGLFFVALATLMLEVLDTRLLSVLTWYHLSFLAVSVAMLGMASGAVLVFLADPCLLRRAPGVSCHWPRWRLRWCFPFRTWRTSSSRFLPCAPARLSELAALAISTLVLTLPFVLSRPRRQPGPDSYPRRDWRAVRRRSRRRGARLPGHHLAARAN